MSSRVRLSVLLVVSAASSDNPSRIGMPARRKAASWRDRCIRSLPLTLAGMTSRGARFAFGAASTTGMAVISEHVDSADDLRDGCDPVGDQQERFLAQRAGALTDREVADLVLGGIARHECT